MASNQDDAEDPNQTEITNGGTTAAPAEEIEALSTFSATHQNLTVKVIPSVTSDGTDWRIVVYGRGVRGSLLETDRPMTDQQAEQLGIPVTLQERVNEALLFAQAELEIPRMLGNQARRKQTLDDIEAMME